MWRSGTWSCNGEGRDQVLSGADRGNDHVRAREIDEVWRGGCDLRVNRGGDQAEEGCDQAEEGRDWA